MSKVERTEGENSFSFPDLPVNEVISYSNQSRYSNDFQLVGGANVASLEYVGQLKWQEIFCGSHQIVSFMKSPASEASP